MLIDVEKWVEKDFEILEKDLVWFVRFWIEVVRVRVRVIN